MSANSGVPRTILSDPESPHKSTICVGSDSASNAKGSIAAIGPRSLISTRESALTAMGNWKASATWTRRARDSSRNGPLRRPKSTRAAARRSHGNSRPAAIARSWSPDRPRHSALAASTPGSAAHRQAASHAVLDLTASASAVTAAVIVVTGLAHADFVEHSRTTSKPAWPSATPMSSYAMTGRRRLRYPGLTVSSRRAGRVASLPGAASSDEFLDRARQYPFVKYW